jgi:plasmid stability protein
MKPDLEILTRANKTENFFGTVLLEDALEDWNLAKDLGELLIRLMPEEVMGHALVARACRHLGSTERARRELMQCRVMTKHPSETDLFVSFLVEEEKLLSETDGPAGADPGV